MKTRTLNQVFNEIAHEQIRQDINLSPGILARIRKGDKQIVKSKIILTGIVIIAVLVIVLVSNPGVAQAMQRLFGYIPGTGFVEQSQPLRVLNGSVQSSRWEIKVTVKQGVIDLEHAVILYQVENIPASLATPDGNNQEICHQLPLLRLPGGSQLQGQDDSGNSWVSGYSRGVFFKPSPGPIKTAIFVLPCIEQTSSSPDTQNWEIPLTFVDAPPQMTVYPIVDLPSPTAAAPKMTVSPSVDLPTPTAAPTKIQGNQAPDQTSGTPSASEITLSLNKYVQTDQNIILLGALKRISSNFSMSGVDSSAVHLLDASGQEIPLVDDPTLADPVAETTQNQSLALTYRTAGKYVPGKANLTVDSAWIRLDENIHFTFNPGQDLAPGKEWQIDQKIEVAGHSVQIKTAKMDESGKGFSFDLETPPGVSEVTLMDLDHPLLGGGGGPNSYGFTYRDGIPSGDIILTITSITVEINGPWKISVDLPPYAVSSTPTQMPGACLTKTTWRTALSNHTASLPTGLAGKLAISTFLKGNTIYHVVIGNLDGSQQKVLAIGEEPSLSPDNRQVIYSSDDGLKRVEISSGAEDKILNTGKRDRGALWSPDGTKIAFTRGPSSGLIGAPGPYDIIISDPDGSNQLALLKNADANTAQAWLPDGKSLIYTVKGPDGSSVRAININTGNIDQLFSITYDYASVAVSPDGKRVAYEELLPGDRYSVFVANLNGSNSRLIVNASPIIATVPKWSPDGQWLILSVHDETLPTENQMPVFTLIEVDTCQIIPLRTLTGYVFSWNR